MASRTRTCFGITLFVLGATAALAQPAAPTNLDAQAVGSGRVNLLFQDNANNETQFDVEARSSSEATFSPVGSIGPNVTALAVNILLSGTTYFFRLRADGPGGTSAYSNVASATTLSSDSPCTPTATAICLNGGRFRVQAMFLTPQGQNGLANTVKLTDDSGYLWFFGATNIEAVIKVLDGCAVNNRYWLFAGGLTNVRVMLTVTDTVRGSSATYLNQQGPAFQPIQDTGAFATCP